MTSSSHSPAAPRWHRRPTERRREILDAAVEAFGRVGYERATLVEVANRAGVSAATVMVYFGSKAGLFQAVIEDRFLTAVADEEALLASARSNYRELVRGLMIRLWSRLQRPGNADLLLVGLANAQSFPETARTMFSELCCRWRRLVSGAIEAGIRAGEFHPADSEAVARAFSGAITGLVLAQRRFADLDPVPPAPEPILHQLLDLVELGLVRRPVDPRP